MAELEIDKEDVHDTSKWRRNVMKRKSNPIGKQDYKPIIYVITTGVVKTYCNHDKQSKIQAFIFERLSRDA